MRILAGGPARETESDLFRLHKQSLWAQREGLVVNHYVVKDTGGPKWDTDKIGRVASARQTMMEDAESHDALFLVDTDIVLGPGVLDRMLRVDADVVYGVFWSRWSGFDAPMPQVWDVYPFGHSQRLVDELRDGLTFTESRWGYEFDSGTVKEVEVLGGGACTLLRGQALDIPYFPLISALQRVSGDDIWDGEDRSFGVRLMAADIRQVAVTGLPIVHLDTTQKTCPEALQEAEVMVGW